MMRARRSRGARGTSLPIRLDISLVCRCIPLISKIGTALILSSAQSGRYPWSYGHIFADGAYAGDKLKDALSELGTWTFEIIKRSDTAKGFEVLPRRWVVERTFAWLNRCRRLAKDIHAPITSAVAWAL